MPLDWPLNHLVLLFCARSPSDYACYDVRLFASLYLGELMRTIDELWNEAKSKYPIGTILPGVVIKKRHSVFSWILDTEIEKISSLLE